MDFRHVFDSLHTLQSLSLSPCLLHYIHPNECLCSTQPTSRPYHRHSIKPSLLSLNLVSFDIDTKRTCSILLDDYHRHSIRHSSIHQHLPDQRSFFTHDHLIRSSLRMITETLDLHHFSIRCPAYELRTDDLLLRSENHLQSLVLDVRIPITFHTTLTQHFVMNHFDHLRRFLLLTDDDFQFTELLLDKCRSMEIVEIISRLAHLKRSTIKYLERVLTPRNYPNLKQFRYWFGSVDAQHLLKHLHKTLHVNFERLRPGFLYDISVVQSPSRSTEERYCILHDHTHEVHQSFHRLPSIHSQQLSLIYPDSLNYKPLYSELQFDPFSWKCPNRWW